MPPVLSMENPAGSISRPQRQVKKPARYSPTNLVTDDEEIEEVEPQDPLSMVLPSQSRMSTATMPAIETVDVGDMDDEVKDVEEVGMEIGSVVELETATQVDAMERNIWKNFHVKDVIDFQVKNNMLEGNQELIRQLVSE